VHNSERRLRGQETGCGQADEQCQKSAARCEETHYGSSRPARLILYGSFQYRHRFVPPSSCPPKALEIYSDTEKEVLKLLKQTSRLPIHAHFAVVVFISQKIVGRVTQSDAGCIGNSGRPATRLLRRTTFVKERSRPAQNLPALARKQLPCCLRQGLAIAMVFVLSFAPVAPNLLAAPTPAKARPNSPGIANWVRGTTSAFRVETIAPQPLLPSPFDFARTQVR